MRLTHCVCGNVRHVALRGRLCQGESWQRRPGKNDPRKSESSKKSKWNTPARTTKLSTCPSCHILPLNPCLLDFKEIKEKGIPHGWRWFLDVFRISVAKSLILESKCYKSLRTKLLQNKDAPLKWKGSLDIVGVGLKGSEPREPQTKCMRHPSKRAWVSTQLTSIKLYSTML